MASEESFFGRMAGAMRRASAAWSGTLMSCSVFLWSASSFWPYSTLISWYFSKYIRIDDDGQKAQKYYFIPEIFFLPCSFMYTEYVETHPGRSEHVTAKCDQSGSEKAKRNQ